MPRFERTKNVLRRLGLFDLAARLWRLVNPRVNAAIKEGKRLDEEFEALLTTLLSHHGMFAIQVGAHDGTTNDPLKRFIKRFDWNAILIEPMPKNFGRLESQYKNSESVSTLNLAVAAVRGKKTMFYVSEEAKSDLGKRCPDWYDQLSSFSRENIEKHVSGILTSYIEGFEVETDTLENIYANSLFPHIDVLHVDAEGHDLEVLSSLNIHKHRPRIIIFEYKHLSLENLKSFEINLSSSGYSLKRFNDDCVAYIPND